jgi:hypothetical protein
MKDGLKRGHSLASTTTEQLEKHHYFPDSTRTLRHGDSTEESIEEDRDISTSSIRPKKSVLAFVDLLSFLP